MTLYGKGFAVAVAILGLAACATTPHQRLAKVTTLQKQARQAYDQGNLAVALQDYRTLTSQMPADNLAWFHLGNVYARLDQPMLAAQAYRHVLQRDPTHSKAWHNLGVIYMHQAEAAFVQSSRTANGDPSLKQASLRMATQLDALSAAPKTGGHHPLAAPASGASAPSARAALPVTAWRTKRGSNDARGTQP